VADVAEVLTDLTAEGAELDAIVSTLDDDGWRTPTPSAGWTISHQIAHLSWTDRASVVAATDADAFAELLGKALENPTGFVDAAAEQGATLAPATLLEVWRTCRADLATALAAVPVGEKVPWFGPPMSATSMATARLMETWAHGQDVADALGSRRTPTARLRHVAHIGVRTVGFAFTVHGLPVPTEPFRVELTGPDGENWTWGPESATDRITGPALDFCLLVTQRRHADDLDVTATGEHATAWLPIAQAFAGLPGAGRKPGEFA
jgi:uncharacterized protein (TIGR03084 family)